jgi:hypothetical protein
VLMDGVVVGDGCVVQVREGLGPVRQGSAWVRGEVPRFGAQDGGGRRRGTGPNTQPNNRPTE